MVMASVFVMRVRQVDASVLSEMTCPILQRGV